jgi:hypothetical protein
MLNPGIGKNAGKVWQTLKEKGPLVASAIKKATGLDDKSLYMALGWLAREGKVKFETKLGLVYVSLSGK